jgi:phosphotransferase system IIB component
MTLRKEFIELLGNWSNIQDLTDIPRRLKKIKKWIKEDNITLTEEEESVITFMKDVQATRVFVRRKPDELEDETDAAE